MQQRQSRKLTQYEAKCLHSALTTTAVRSLTDTPMALSHFVTVMPQDLATILLETGYIKIGVHKHYFKHWNGPLEGIEYVWITEAGRRALELVCLA